MGDRAQLAAGDQLAGRGHGRGVAVVEPDRALDPGLADGVGNRPGVVGGEADRLLDPDVLAGLGHGHADLAVEEVRRGDADRLHAGVGDQLPPVAGGGREAELGRGLPGPARDLVGDRDQLRGHGQLREVVQHAGVGLGVGPAHPPEPGHRHPDRPSPTGRAHAHTFTSCRRDLANKHMPRGWGQAGLRTRKEGSVDRPGRACPLGYRCRPEALAQPASPPATRPSRRRRPTGGYLAELAAALAGPGSPGPRPWPRSPSWPPGRAGLGLLATGRYLASVGRNSASSATSLPLGRAPTIRACSMPPVNTRRVGRLRMP